MKELIFIALAIFIGFMIAPFTGQHTGSLQWLGLCIAVWVVLKIGQGIGGLSHDCSKENHIVKRL